MKTVKPLLSDKGVNTMKISLVDRGKTVTEDKEVAKTLNQYFSTAVNSLNIIENKSLPTETGNLEDPVELAIKKFEITKVFFQYRKLLISMNFFNFQK